MGGAVLKVALARFSRPRTLGQNVVTNRASFLHKVEVFPSSNMGVGGSSCALVPLVPSWRGVVPRNVEDRREVIFFADEERMFSVL